MNKKLDNPFRYGQTVENTCFFDRLEEQRTLKEDFVSGQNVILIAPRRYGKSSLIKKVLAWLDERSFFAIYVDLFRINSVAKMVDILGHEFATATKTPLNKFGDFFKKWAPRLKPKIIFKSDEIPEVTFDWDKTITDRKSDLAELMQSIYAYTKKEKVKAVIVFDEFQEIMEWGDVSLLKELRALIQSHESICYCFAGSKQHLISDIFMNKNSPFFNFGKIFSLNLIPKEEFQKFLIQSFKPLNFQNVKELTDKILDFTHLHPYYTQMLAYHLWQQHILQQRSDLDWVIDYIIKLQQDAYVSFWDNLTLKQQNLLRCVAAGEKAPLTQAAVINRWDLGSAATVTKVIKTLEGHGFIERQKGLNVKISDPFFELWIKKL